MSFNQWLKDHIEEDTPVGDLARDVKLDKNWPKQDSSKRAFTKHMKEINASDGTIEAFNTAWKRYMNHQYQRKAKSKSKNTLYYHEGDMKCELDFSIPRENGWHSIFFKCPDVPSLEKLFKVLQDVIEIEIDGIRVNP